MRLPILELPPRGSARRRLALTYSALFLALGTVLIVVILLAERSGSTVSAVTRVGGSISVHPVAPNLVSAPGFIVSSTTPTSRDWR